MAALTKDRNTVRKTGAYASGPVKGGVKIYAGGMVNMTATGLLVPASDAANEVCVGVARASIDTTGLADGARTLEYWREGCFEFATGQDMTGKVGTAVCVADDQTVDLAGITVNDVVAGVISEVNSAASAYIDISRRA